MTKINNNKITQIDSLAPMIIINNLAVDFQQQRILQPINVQLAKNAITVLSGRSGSGKTTFLRALNRLNECFPAMSTQGEVIFNFKDNYCELYKLATNKLPKLRQKVGMLFQTPNPLPLSIERNIRQPLTLLTHFDKQQITNKIENALQQVGLWNEVKDRLNKPAMMLSGGQQQRLCLARVLALEPEVLLLDEPTASLDPCSTEFIEDCLLQLKPKCTMVLVSHQQQQAEKLADQTLFFSQGRITNELELVLEGIDIDNLRWV